MYKFAQTLASVSSLLRGPEYGVWHAASQCFGHQEPTIRFSYF